MKMNALQTIQLKLKAPKSQFNKFGNYNYRNCEDIQEAVKPLLGETNSTLTLSDDIVEIGGALFVRSTATLSYPYPEVDSTQQIKTTVTAYAMHAKEQKGMNDAQITGAASSYARKYALNGLFLIDDTKDADSTNDGSKPEEKKTPKATKPPVIKPEASKSETPKSEQPKELEWLNPGTKNWEYVVKRLGEGVLMETIEKNFRISEENKKKLNEAKA
jgi:hypothetical protein